MTLTDQVTKNIVKKLIKGEDYRIEIVTLINAEFLQITIEFFKKVAFAKIKNEDISTDWYKKEMLAPNLPADEIAINSGLNKNTISKTSSGNFNLSWSHYLKLMRIDDKN